MIKSKKGVTQQIIGVFILVLVVTILGGMTFLFTSAMKTTALRSSTQTVNTTLNETGWVNNTGYTLKGASYLGFNSLNIIAIQNVSAGDDTGKYLDAANWTIDSTTGYITNKSDNPQGFYRANITYSFNYVNSENSKAYLGINGTESSGFTIITYLPLLFLAIIFGAILIVTLRVVLPYMNLGNQMGGTI